MSDVISIEEKIRKKQTAQFANAVADSLGVTPEGLAEMVDAPLDSIHEGLIEAFQRQSMYRAHNEAIKERERKKGMDPDTCFNGVCDRHVQHEHEHQNPETGRVTFSGRSNFCKEGRAQGCIFRLLEHPYSDPFVDIPSHNECVRILQRIGYVRGGSFEEELGTNFMFSKNTSKLWQAYVILLVETGRLDVPKKELEEMLEHFSHDTDHAKYVCGNDLAHEYFRDRELPDTVATVSELVAQRNALLAFIRGELDWPDGRCPCGEDFHWNGVAHTEHCRFKDKENHNESK